MCVASYGDLTRRRCFLLRWNKSEIRINAAQTAESLQSHKPTAWPKSVQCLKSLAESELLAIDGTCMFSSKSVHCSQCNGTKTYFHHMLCAALVHPFKKIVIPLIIKSDGATKNDSERSACKRFLEHFRREHPQRLWSKMDSAPYLRLLGYLNLRYIRSLEIIRPCLTILIAVTRPKRW